MILLDRDGVLNRLVVDAEHGTVDSPLHPSQVVVFPFVAAALARLARAGYDLAIVSNQPAWAKGKTTRGNLDAVHAAVLKAVEEGGGKIRGSHICLHRAEDNCDCRKPKTGLLRAALGRDADLDRSWMVGDGVTDVQAGAALGLQTAFLGPRKCDACKIMEERSLTPNYWGPDLAAFVDYLLSAACG